MKKRSTISLSIQRSCISVTSVLHDTAISFVHDYFARFLAVLFIAGALLCLIYLSLQFWTRYQNSAVVIVVDIERDLFKISKPAIFICPVPNVVASKIPDAFRK